MFKQKNLKSVHKSKAVFVALAAVILFCLAAVVISFWFERTAVKADTLTVTSTENGKVSLGELCERHDVLHVVVPDGYLNGETIREDKDKSLHDLQAAGKITALKQSDMLTITTEINEIEDTVVESVVFSGWKASQNDNLRNKYQKILLIIPKEVTEIKFDCGLSYNTADLIGLAFENGSQVEKIPEEFLNESYLEFCILSESVKKIGKHALVCPRLTDLVMPAVEEIDEEAFFNGLASSTGFLSTLYHISLPSSLKTIGKDAFKYAVSLCDVENNSDYIDVSEHFEYVMNIYGSSVKNPAGGKSYLHVWENFGDREFTNSDGEKTIREVNNSLVFSYNTLRRDVLATTETGNVDYSDKWYFITLEGLEDGDIGGASKTEYHFPQTIDLNATRTKIKWDWLDSRGNKRVNEFQEGATVNSYDISKRAMTFKFMTRIFLPEGVTAIGDFTFFGSQVRILDIPSTVTHIGKNAINQTHRITDSFIYVRHRDLTAINVGQYAFSIQGWWWPFRDDLHPWEAISGKSRTFIFSDLSAYKSDESNLAAKFNKMGDSEVTFTYLVPIKTVAVGAGDTSTIVEYRLHNKSYDFTQNDNATWSQKSSVKLPKLDGYTQTVWYRDLDDIDDPNESKIADIGYINGELAKEASELYLYTKYMSTPDFQTQNYKYDEILELENKELTFAQALQFTADDYSDYAADFVSFVNSNNETPEQSVVKNAGAYTIKVTLNPQWGVWDGTHNHTFTVNVARAEIDLGNHNNLPEFVTDTGTLGGTEKGTPIYYYDDGYYLYAKSNSDIILNTYTVTNSYVRYNGSEKWIAASSDFDLYTVTGKEKTRSTESGRIIASFEFTIDDTNYVFVNKTFSENQEEFSKRGISYSSSTQYATSVNVSKIWYIVKQQNWLIDYEFSGENTDNETYSLLTFNGDSVATLVYESEFGTGKYEVHMPKVAKGSTLSDITFTITYGNGNAPITVGSNHALQEKPVSELSNYINSAMPVGSYTIRIKAGESEDGGVTLPEITETIKLSVLPKDIQCSSVVNLLTSRNGENYVANTFEHTYDRGELFLFDDASAATLANTLNAINAQLNAERKNLQTGSDNVWSDSFYDKYYNDLVIKYNLDIMQTSEYYTLDDLKEWTNSKQVPRNAGQYTVYYSLSALNYNTVGGSNVADRRNYKFATLIYREISALEIAQAINGNTYTYNGSNVYATVNYSQYYSTTYNDDGGYINAGNHTVTLTINDTELTRWKNETADGVTINSAQGTATITYNVQKAQNKWLYMPNIVRWTWGEYNPELNVIAGTAEFGTQNILYSVLDENKQALNVQVEVGGSTKTVSLSDFGAVSNDIAVALGSLPAGSYYLRGKVAGTDNYQALNDFDYEFVIAKISNTWNNTPHMTNWQYTGFRAESNFILGEPNYRITGKTVKYGIFTTEPADSSALNSTGSNIFTDIQSVADYLKNLTVGEYWLAAYYDGTESYAELFHKTSFHVNKATNNSWNDNKLPAISGWTYGEYATGLFADGEADFGTPLYTVQTVGQGNQSSAVAGFSGLSYAELVSKLDSLNAGNYNLYVTTSSTDNYVAARALNVRFTISKAANAWTSEPTIEGWTYGSPSSVSADYQTQYDNGGITKEFYLARMVNNVWIADESKGVIKDITKADAGIYVYIVTAAASANYDELKSVMSFEIQKRANAWKTGKEPTLFYNWMSGEADYTFVMPEAEAHNELMRFDLLHLSDGTAKNGMDAQTFLTELKKLTNGTFQVRMYIGNDIIYNSETEQNKAALESYKRNYYYISSTCEILIAARVNSFKYEPRISTILYLGDRKNWEQPTAEAALSDSEIVFTYKDAVTGELLGNEIPTIPGRYILTATATASFSEPIARSVEFKVQLSPNSWISAPTINGWQEDNKPNAPTSNASIGADKVVYTYANVKTPNVILKERPTAEGEYIMYAVLEMEGYETLRAQYRFTVAPAFDTQLVIAAIVLAAIAIVLAGVVLYFAIRRYKEN